MYKPISTYTGRHFDPYHAVAADLDVRDIAHAQSLMTRANGHFPAFYSVGQHSLACAREALVRGEANQTALFCLLHDGAEAYMSDVTRPVKARLPRHRAPMWASASSQTRSTSSGRWSTTALIFGFTASRRARASRSHLTKAAPWAPLRKPFGLTR